MQVQPLVIEIRTVPGPRAEAYVDAQRWEPDSTLSRLDNPPKAITELKSPELRDVRLAEWTAAQKLKLDQSALRKKQQALDKAALYWWTAQVVAVATLDYQSGQSATFSDEDERRLLLTVFAALQNKYRDHYLVGKSCLEFDFPMLTGRGMAHNLPLPHQLLSGRVIHDVHDIFGWRTNGSQRSTIEDYAFGLGLEIPKAESTKALYQMATLGNEAAWAELEQSTLSEAKMTGEVMRRYYQEWSKDLTVQHPAFSIQPEIPF